MDGTIDFIILEHDDVAGCALIAGAVDGVVPAIDGYNTPYVVATGYDHATRNWEDCTLFDDIVKAKLAYEGLRGREYSLDGVMRRDDSATSDIRGFTDAELATHPIDPPETASAATRATFGGTAAWPVYRGHKN